MKRLEPLAPLLSVLHDLVHWFKCGNVRGLVIGGVAASLLGRPRVTHDVDVLVLLKREEYEEFLAEGKQLGFIPRLSDAIDFAQKNRVFLVCHEPSGINVDISIGVLPFEEEAIGRGVTVDLGGVGVPIPTPEDLIIMKAVAHRPRDMADIESILEAHSSVDLEYVLRRVDEFSSALEMPEILNDVRLLLNRYCEK
jgi:hypothetical protein